MEVRVLDSVARDVEGLGRYVGLTYPGFLSRWPFRALWRRFMCPRKMHLFDEVASSGHYLVCDACELSVHIALIETSEQACARAGRLRYIETTATERSETDSGHSVPL